MAEINRAIGEPLGKLDDFEDAKRESIRTHERIDDIGGGLKYSETVEVPANGGTTRVLHGLGSIPNSIGICAVGAPAPFCFVKSKDRETVTVQNDDPVNDATVDVSVFG